MYNMQCYLKELHCQNDFTVVKSGYWWSWEHSKSTTKQEQYEKFTKEIVFQNDSYSYESVSFQGDLPIVYRCPLEKGCNGGVTDRDMCSEEYAGPLCTLREIGYFFWFSECVRCPPIWRSVVQLVCVVPLLILFIFVLFKIDKLAMSGQRFAATVVDQLAAKLR